MPILDNIRLSQISEAMNYDKNMQRQALDIIKRGVAVMDPEAPENAPNDSLKESDELIKELVNGLVQLLEKKYNERFTY
jgi:predicted component of type VI protein secretion system